MQHAEYLATIEAQCRALRAAAVRTGPEAPVPTCPKWTVQRLVDHLAKVHSWVRAAIADPSGANVTRGQPPADWTELLRWWDEQLQGMLAGLADPTTPAWLPWTRYEQTTRSWARRQAHETAIHRLDAEHALAGSADASAVPSLVFDPEFAADGVDELLAWMLPTRAKWDQFALSGSVLVHAADAGRMWRVVLHPGQPGTIEPVTAAFEADVTVAGTADAVYRRVWGRPSHASVTGDVRLLEPLAAP
ncbi:maleylpyruvate isomerase N-terminal domain-containing protein [Amycolatopsis thermoflava]|uniref:maleylpyruvate isomerase N-terminal domain-containing protein n=1 Tax=Amycolatopsis thermoflava TaxID=84480 RepID=UPI000A029AF5|nr:maleylpyruvate isomerase N-terminal domain-containing protein [Amycolatopsis thermoflava]